MLKKENIIITLEKDKLKFNELKLLNESVNKQNDEKLNNLTDRNNSLLSR